MDTTSSSALERFFALIRRDLGAKDVRVVPSADAVPQSSHTLFATLPDDRVVVIVLPEAPSDQERDVLERRLGMLTASFADALGSPKSDASRPHSRLSVPASLHEELRAVATRAGATDAVVIDVDSPVLWGSASREQTADDHAGAIAALAPEVSRPQLSTGLNDSDPSLSGLLSEVPSPKAPPVEDAEVARSKAAVALVRKLPYVGQAHKGRHFRHAEATEQLGVLALSFSGIYVLVLVFEGAFDELRAERAAADALPRIERLVLALPPFDPEPTPIGDAMALRKPRRR